MEMVRFTAIAIEAKALAGNIAAKSGVRGPGADRAPGAD